MLSPLQTRRFTSWMLVIAIFGGFIFGFTFKQDGLAQDGPAPLSPSPYQSLSTSSSEEVAKIYLPVAPFDYPSTSLFGVETYGPLHSDSPLLEHSRSLSVGWLRLGHRISWRELQPYPGAPIQWELLESFEQELYQLKDMGISALVVIYDTPLWATNGKNGIDGKPSTCAAIRPERFGDFAAFMRAIVNRYKAPEYDVHAWELGNEPDVDPGLVASDSGVGCWGDENDPFYGGRHYGEMLKVVTPAIKSEDPRAQVWIGGLLMAGIEKSTSLRSHPELLVRGITAPLSPKNHPLHFFKGILESGAAPFFEVAAYHWYPFYYLRKTDFDLVTGLTWDDSGGGVVGKANYLRDVMKEYGVSKPVSLNETGLGCSERTYWCNPPDDQFYQAQANYLVRSFVRGLSQDITRYSWYALEEPGWRYLGLLDDSYQPKPSYQAYQQLGRELKNARLIGPVSYGEEIEAYSFQMGNRIVQVIWTIEDQRISLRIPSARYIAARTRDGVPIPPSTLDGDHVVTVGFEPVYLTLWP